MIYNEYRDWNKALWQYFFPSKDKDVILFVDDKTIEQVVEKFGNGNFSWLDKNKTYSENFLSTCFMPSNKMAEFKNKWREWNSQYRSNLDRVNVGDWKSLTLSLATAKIPNPITNPLAPKEPDIPAYFAMLCSIMLVAGYVGADHKLIRDVVSKYMGEECRCKPGEVILDLMTQLHKDVNCFNPNRLAVQNSPQCHISRIKYHLLLKPEEYQDFIDFLEVGNLSWDSDTQTYDFYVDNILVPALLNAGKNNIARIVINPESIPYVKNILQSDLNFGKLESDYNNSIVERQIKWYYQLDVDYFSDSPLLFSVITDFQTPFGLTLNSDREFKIREDGGGDSLCAFNVNPDIKNDQRIVFEGATYRINNISQDQDVKYFAKITSEIYKQVEEPLNDFSCVAFVKNGTRKISRSWQLIEELSYNGYSVYSMPTRINVPNRNGAHELHTEDKFKFVRRGTWCSMLLEDGDRIFWDAMAIGASRVEIASIIKGKDGKSYFRLTPNENGNLYGNIIVLRKGKEVDSSQIKCSVSWNGTRSVVFLNGWGEATDEQLDSDLRSSSQRSEFKTPNFTTEFRGSDILLQILIDIADENGCVSQSKTSAAIDFSLSFFGIDGNVQNRTAIIYALRHLGYIIAKKLPGIKDGYINQLVRKYQEPSNYSLNNLCNARLVRGAYNLLDFHSTNLSARIRPYTDADLSYHPEYQCLPDSILTNDILQGYTQYEYTTFDYMISIMKNMREFCTMCKIERDRLPFMDKDQNGDELLFTKDSRGLAVKHQYYNREGIQYKIPKELARVYVQNYDNKPVCMIKRENNYTDYSRIHFLKGMGIPETLNLALCNSNLGLPVYSRVFFEHQQEIFGISPDPNSTTLLKTFVTHSTNRSLNTLSNGIEKLSSRSVSDDLTGLDSVAFFRENVRFKFKLYSLEHLITIHNNIENRTVCFIKNRSRFILLDGAYYRVMSSDPLNEFISDIVTKPGIMMVDGTNFRSLPSICGSEVDLLDQGIDCTVNGFHPEKFFYCRNRLSFIYCEERNIIIVKEKDSFKVVCFIQDGQVFVCVGDKYYKVYSTKNISDTIKDSISSYFVVPIDMSKTFVLPETYGDGLYVPIYRIITSKIN